MNVIEELKNRIPNAVEIAENILSVSGRRNEDDYLIKEGYGEIIVDYKGDLTEDQRKVKRFFKTVAEVATQAGLDVMVTCIGTDWVEPAGNKAKKVFALFEKIKANTSVIDGIPRYSYVNEREKETLPRSYYLEWDLENGHILLKNEGATMFMIKNTYEAENIFRIFEKELEIISKARQKVISFVSDLQDFEEHQDGSCTFKIFEEIYKFTIQKLSVSGENGYKASINRTRRRSKEYQTLIYNTVANGKKKKELVLKLEVLAPTLEEIIDKAKTEIDNYFTQKRMREMLRA